MFFLQLILILPFLLIMMMIIMTFVYKTHYISVQLRAYFLSVCYVFLVKSLNTHVSASVCCLGDDIEVKLMSSMSTKVIYLIYTNFFLFLKGCPFYHFKYDYSNNFFLIFVHVLTCHIICKYSRKMLKNTTTLKTGMMYIYKKLLNRMYIYIFVYTLI